MLTLRLAKRLAISMVFRSYCVKLVNVMLMDSVFIVKNEYIKEVRGKTVFIISLSLMRCL